MARMVSDLLARVRQVLQDLDQDNYRYPTSDMVGYLNDATLECRRLRPDLFLGTYLQPLPMVSETPIDYSTIAMPVPDSCFTACVDYVAGRVELRDDEFAVDGRAMTFVQSFSQKLMGGG